ncbi:MAG: AAA-like domain-containing protein, partial [Clostridia bacterium]
MAQKKRFNVTGPCIPALHYMVDTSKMIDLIVRDYVDAGEYFTMNRARQYGKTTTLGLLEKALRDQFVIIRISFEGFGTAVFADEGEFITAIIYKCARSLQRNRIEPQITEEWLRCSENLNMPKLEEKIAALIQSTSYRMVLMIDEVDKSSNNQLFMDFLGMLRDMYLEREQNQAPAFHSVILAGVHDIKNLKMKLRPDEKHGYNSPWNIAARFDVDMSFSALEIATMLHAYEDDHHTGMDAGKVARHLFYYTSGYPFLVSLLCKTMDDERLDWTETGVMDAVKNVLYHSRDISLFQDIQKNIENHDEFKALLVQILVEGIPASYNGLNPATDLGIIYGVLVPCDGKVMISNRIFETFIYNYLISVAPNRPVVEEYTERTKYIANGKLSMPLVLERFAAFMRCEYRDEDGACIEREGR